MSDVPPFGLVPDAGLLANMVDAVLFVVRAGVTPHGQLQKAIEAVGSDRTFGVVLNGGREADSSDGGTYYHSHHSEPQM